jgi:transcriptional regulator with XRE-family HTH domain
MADRREEARARFAANVERLRHREGISVAELVRRSELDQETVEELLLGEAEPRLDTIYLIAGALGVDPANLFDGVAWIPDGRGGGEYRFCDDSD